MWEEGKEAYSKRNYLNDIPLSYLLYGNLDIPPLIDVHIHPTQLFS
jgi:hypothetical protein